LNDKYNYNIIKNNKNDIRIFYDENLKITIETPYHLMLLMIGHRERKEYWEKALIAIKNLYRKNLKKIYIIIDGNTDKDNYMADMAHDILDVVDDLDINIIQISQRGKRGAMFYGFQLIRQEFINNIKNIDVVVSDSDTELSKSCLLSLQDCLRSHPDNGCVTGMLDIYNLKDGFLPKIINVRYAYAFMIERGSSSYMGCMTCCSGPISIYKLEILDEMILQKFITQKFLNVKCEPGDDRHLTNLVLALGYYARQTNIALASTEAPETWYRFLNQQLRWSRSYYRELYWQLKAVPKQSLYLCLIISYETLFPLFICIWFIKILYFTTEFHIIIKGSIFFISILLFRTFVLFLYMKNLNSFYNFLYYPIYMTLLLPTKIYAMLTTLNNNWVTAPRNSRYNINISPHFFFLILWNLFLLFGVVNQICKIFNIFIV
jgi:hyaluronan synthase